MTRWVPACLGLFLTACMSASTDIVVRNVQHETLYSPSLVRWVADPGRDVALRVAAPGGEERWSGAVARSLASMTWLPFGNVTARPDGSERSNFHIAAVIGASVHARARDACSGSIDTGALGPVDGRSHILIAFCNGERMISTARVVTGTLESPESPVLANAVVAGAIQAFPNHDPDRPEYPEQIIIP